VVDGAMLHLIKMWLEAPVEETDERGNKRQSTRNRTKVEARRRISDQIAEQGAETSAGHLSCHQRRENLNRMLTGWANYFCLGQSAKPAVRSIYRPAGGYVWVAMR